MISLRQLTDPFYPVYKYLNRSYFFFLEKGVIKLFGRPDIAMRCALNQKEVTPESIISNYFQGLFLLAPNDSPGTLWLSAPERAVITPESAHIPTRVQQYLKKADFEIRENQRFRDVVEQSKREKMTWVNDEIIELYTELHHMGYGESMEAYLDNELVGGLWGFRVGGTFSLLSTFYTKPHAGNQLFVALIEKLHSGDLQLIDCGLMNSHFQKFGAFNVSIDNFCERVVANASPAHLQVID
jgi:leucyl/phenylalanyl-tRNA---protein transferase